VVPRTTAGARGARAAVRDQELSSLFAAERAARALGSVLEPEQAAGYCHVPQAPANAGRPSYSPQLAQAERAKLYYYADWRASSRLTAIRSTGGAERHEQPEI